MTDLKDILASHLADWRSGWSMGGFGAVAEFMWEADEAAFKTANGGPLERATARGGVRLEPEALARVIPIAYELPSAKAHRWSHALALCIPQEEISAARRSRLTELGPDVDAVRCGDRGAILFDLGLALPQGDFCVRTADPELLATLRACTGLSVFDPASEAMPAILKGHPHRIAVTALGRVEVYQKIGGPDTGGVSPPGPHTHLLPQVLRSGLTHSSNTQFPTAWCLWRACTPGIRWSVPSAKIASSIRNSMLGSKHLWLASELPSWSRSRVPSPMQWPPVWIRTRFHRQPVGSRVPRFA